MKKEKKIPRLEDLERVLVDEGPLSERWEWRIKGTEIIHHPYEPAVQFEDGDWEWYWMDKRHRLDGPARFVAGKYQYWIGGESFSREEWERHTRRIEWLRNQMERI